MAKLFRVRYETYEQYIIADSLAGIIKYLLDGYREIELVADSDKTKNNYVKTELIIAIEELKNDTHRWFAHKSYRK